MVIIRKRWIWVAGAGLSAKREGDGCAEANERKSFRFPTGKNEFATILLSNANGGRNLKQLIAQPTHASELPEGDNHRR
jgi:hypothetical protein